MRSHIFLITLFLFLKSYSQQNSKISFESGAIINNPLIKGERLTSHGESTTYTDWTYNYYKSAGYYLKYSYERKLISKNKWSLFFPIGISFISQITKYKRQGESWGCFGGESADELKSIKHTNVNLFFGTNLQYQNDKFRYTGSLILNNCFTLDSKTRSTPYNANDTYFNTDDQFAYNLYVSSQFCVLYHIKRNMWIGPVCEIFYTNCSQLILNKIQRSNPYYESDYGPSIKITGKNIWINPGIKLQLDLK